MVYEGLMRPAKKPVKLVEPAPEIASTSNETILGRIAREYQSYVDRRRVQERIVIKNALVKERIPHPTEEVYCTNFDSSILTIHFTIFETLTFFNKVFPSLLELPLPEQQLIFRSYMPTVGMIEGFFRTSRVFGGFDQFMMCSEIMCVNMQLPDEWLPPHEGGANRSSLVESMRLFINDQMGIVVPSFERAKITDTEMHALLALILCDSDPTSECSERLLTSLDAIRSEVLEDLRQYYQKELGLIDYSMRLGNLMTLCHAIREGTSLFQESFRMQVAIFDLYVKETLIREYFL
ncbi:hypothetical protein PMAYCL1PPCAC_17460 [Pristionchus mayeri]|uniref:NR LBD domain-containing protein n=1 Tax=Pristionchus mayeri TaxID=1317129 RepID=A0AAN5I0I9_9BILA|nr:hypothetical protein PMAYCL1PPCAC_17460 [Pristionchus mayeri]